MLDRERKIISPDLDIFGSDDDESAQGTEGAGLDDASMDIFGGLGESETADDTSAASDETGEAQATAEEGTSSEGDTQTETNTDEGEKTQEEIDFDKIFDELQNEASKSGNPELESLVEELRNQNADLIAESKILQKQLDVANEKLMGRVGDEAGMGIYKGIIDKLESNPKIMMLAKFWGDDNDKIKQKLINILSDSLYELTGQDVSDLINQSQSDKIMAVAGNTASTEAPSFKNKEKDDEPMDYESSINDLF